MGFGEDEADISLSGFSQTPGMYVILWSWLQQWDFQVYQMLKWKQTFSSLLWISKQHCQVDHRLLHLAFLCCPDPPDIVLYSNIEWNKACQSFLCMVKLQINHIFLIQNGNVCLSLCVYLSSCFFRVGVGWGGDWDGWRLNLRSCTGSC